MTPPINPIYPIAQVTSVQQLMEIAVGMEEEAAQRYEQLAELMRRRGESDLAATFRDLSVLERSHEAGLGAWAQREGRPLPTPQHFSWQFPETFSLEEADGLPLTPYQALAIAVRNEERAFSFYTYLAALADTVPDIRSRAEALAREELKHVSELRRLRRRAYHGEVLVRPAGVPSVGTLLDLHRLAWGLESGSAALLDAAAACLDDAGQVAQATLIRHAGARAAERSQALGQKAGGGPLPPGSHVCEGALASGLLETGTLTPAGGLGLCERDAQEVLEIYLTIAERSKDEHLLNAAQELAEAAVARLAVVRSQMGQGD